MGNAEYSDFGSLLDIDPPSDYDKLIRGGWRLAWPLAPGFLIWHGHLLYIRVIMRKV